MVFAVYWSYSQGIDDSFCSIKNLLCLHLLVDSSLLIGVYAIQPEEEYKEENEDGEEE